jgi:dihydrofolate reductase
MSMTVLYMAMSLDGRIAGDNDDLSWLDRYKDVDYGFDQFFAGIGAIIQGRRAYEIEVAAGYENVHPVPTFVLSHSEPERKPERADVFFADADIAVVLQRAKSITDKDIWIEGGANVAQQFLKRDLLDRIVLGVIPVVLGDGILLFNSTEHRIELALKDVERFDKDAIVLTYETISDRT